MSEKNLKWDRHLYNKSSALQYQLGALAIERLGNKQFKNILEIGSGNALLTIDLANKYPNSRIVGIEISKDQCEQSSENIQRNDVNNIEIVCMDALDIAYENQFDLVFSNSAIHWIPDLEKMYNLLNQALKPGGEIMIQTGHKEYGMNIQVILKIVRVKEFREFIKDLKIPWRFLTEVENRKILEDANFKDINIELYEHRFNFENEADLLNYHKAAALVPFLTAAPEEIHGQLVQKYIDIWYEIKKEKDENPLEVYTTRVFLTANK